jgi:hypothetical protein
MKSPFKSKTLWGNLIMTALAFWPALAEKMNPEAMVSVMAAVNFLLRMVTKDKLQLGE